MRHQRLGIAATIFGSADIARWLVFGRRTTIALLVLASFLLSLPLPAKACGPFFTDAIFVYTKHPDFPLERFAAGQLGVLRPNYARSYLFAAYRNLIGEKLSTDERSALQSLWNERLSQGSEINDGEWIKTWNDARAQVPGIAAPPQIRAFRNRAKPHEYESYLNCQQDAFDNAASTLAENIKRYGTESTQVRNWVEAQDSVFANCGEGQRIPEPFTTGADAPAVADRAYQIAAANFYAGNFDAAAKQFDEIAGNRSSPWRARAPYLAARSLVRKASLAERAEDGKPALAEAESRLKRIGENKDHAVPRLLGLVRLRLHPELKLHELANLIVRKDATVVFKQDVWDYTILLDKYLGDEGYDSSKQSVPVELLSDDVTDWILNLQDESENALNHSLERWERTHSLPWLVAALTNADGNTPNLQLLLNAGGRVDRASPAFASVAFHSVRLLTGSGHKNEARQMLERILSGDRSTLPASAVNLFLSQRQVLSQNLEEFLQNAPRVPAGFSDDSDGREIPEDDSAARETASGSRFFFDVDSRNVFNQAMPLAVLSDAALSKTLPPNLRRDVAQAAFMRANLLDDREQVARLSILLGDIYPELKSHLAAYGRQATPEARRFAGAYLSLKFPGLRPYVTAGTGRASSLGEIDSYRDNWWCAEPPASAPDAETEGSDSAKAKPNSLKAPEFLIASQPVAARQSSTLRALGVGPNYLCRIVVDWTNKNPADPRAPEALHLAVKSTRYGCTDKETGRWSKAAYDLLHRRYPNSSWAKQTKYWFKD